MKYKVFLFSHPKPRFSPNYFHENFAGNFSAAFLPSTSKFTIQPIDRQSKREDQSRARKWRAQILFHLSLVCCVIEIFSRNQTPKRERLWWWKGKKKNLRFFLKLSAAAWTEEIFDFRYCSKAAIKSFAKSFNSCLTESLLFRVCKEDIEARHKNV